MAIYLNRSLIIWAIALLLLGLCFPAAAHNSAVAIAVPVEGIEIDGDLSGWPADMVRYPEARTFQGEVPQGDDQTVVVLKVEG